MGHRTKDLLLKSRIIALSHPNAVTDKQVACFSRQLEDPLITRCTPYFKGAQNLFDYFRMEMELYHLTSVEALHQHFSRLEKRTLTQIHRYMQGDLLKKVSMEWRASLIFEVAARLPQEEATMHEGRISDYLTRFENMHDSYVPTIRRKPVRNTSCY